tara:strand:+ start:3761 stop:4063 length:303 start_codon:yes stop_codon:yes gene_type:complete
MKTTSLKTIYLSKDELKEAIADFIAKGDKSLATHVRANKCNMSWYKDSEFMVQIENEVQDKLLSGGNGMSRILRMAENSMNRHGAVIDRILDVVEGKSSK